MKKCQFYSMMRTDNGPAAVLHDGYTDGTYYYYKLKGARWCAIHPVNGVQVAYAHTRKECAENAHAPGMAEKIAEALQRMQDAAQRYADAVEKAKGAA